MQELKSTPEVMEQCGRYYIQEGYVINYEIMISVVKINPYHPFGRYLYICALWDINKNKIAKNYKHYLEIGGF